MNRWINLITDKEINIWLLKYSIQNKQYLDFRVIWIIQNLLQKKIKFTKPMYSIFTMEQEAVRVCKEFFLWRHIWLMQILHILEFCSASWLDQIQKCAESAWVKCDAIKNKPFIKVVPKYETHFLFSNSKPKNVQVVGYYTISSG